ncbi:TtuD3 hydroxypyruvate reductase [Litchfieldella anticariensis FP35 = DSM 16096]|uniref:TtuD3 hydroxypyruvate reductase n=1 Tax=Litchfieldella anticariensis (strain DSM 16096 / CECT 5854 / CIP 108499 / LMG 22089 / FP35) TaxID=1121939 RepID=S2KFE2_LITA3|nr:glycerate kinase [Halomonas anticariensis]EPC00640.1 TtuD3 hydroxypyruvate reductase [Halomonas anticariensis FP35 = DSM 16096]
MNAPAPFAPFDSEAATRQWLTRLAQTVVAAVHPDTLLPNRLPEPPAGRTVVVGAGKAAAAMAHALETAWQRHYPQAELSGLVVTRYGHGETCRHIEVLEASHPMPDELGEQAARRMLDIVRDLGPDDLVIALISGGGSALMSLPAPGLTLHQKQALNKALLRCGAPIREINTVRRHLSAIKGGRLAACAHPAQVVTYLISDVPGDDPTLIASGPTLPDDSTPMDALAILERYGIDIPDSVRRHLIADSSAPRRDDPGFARDEAAVLARAHDALQAARESAKCRGLEVRVLGDDLEGEARDLGRAQARMALVAQGEIERPLLILSGGETSVTVRGDGRGGRNVEYLLGLFETLKGAEGIYALAIDTDGIDGSEDNAGALIGPECWVHARTARLSPADYLARNDAYSFFAELDDLIVTGPTRTNVNDFRAILVLPRIS